MDYLVCSICATNPARTQTAGLDLELYVCDQCSQNRIHNSQVQKHPTPDLIVGENMNSEDYSQSHESVLNSFKAQIPRNKDNLEYYKDIESRGDQSDTESSENHLLSQYILRYQQSQDKIETLNAQLNQKDLDLNNKLVKESDMKLLGFKNINQAMIKKLHLRDSEISQLKSQLGAQDSEISQLKSQYEAFHNQMLGKDSEISKLKSQYESMNLQKINQESQLIERINSLKSGLRDIKGECLNLKQDNQNLYEEFKRFYSEASSLNSNILPHLQTIKTQTQLYSTKIEEFNIKTQELHDDNQKIAKKLKVLQDLHAEKEEEAKNIQQFLVMKNQEVQSLQLNIEELIQSHSNVVAQYKNQLTELHILYIKDDQNSKAKMKHHKDTIYSLKQQVNDLNSEIITLKTLADSQSMSLEQLKNQQNQVLQEFEQTLHNKDKEMHCICDESKKLSSENIYFQEVISNLKSEKQHLIDSLESTNSKIKSQESDLYKQSVIHLNLEKIKASQDLDIERLRFKCEDLYSLMDRSYEEYKNHDKDLKTIDLLNASTDSETITWNVDKILEELQSISSINCIYIAKRGTRNLVSYNVSTQESATYQLNNIHHNFKYTSTCALSNGDVLITGGCHPPTGDTYLFRVKDKQCYQLCSLIYPRGFISLIYNDKKVYAFGGSTSSASKKAEEYDISTNTWKELPDMMYAREGSSCINLKNKIYIIGGRTRNIEEYNIESRTYRIIDFSVSSYGNVGALVEHKIYIIGQSDLFIADQHFSPLETKEKCWDKLVILLSNVVIDRESISYFNHWTSRIERLSLRNYERKDIITL